MTLTKARLTLTSTSRSQNRDSDSIRRRALERLYERKAAVDGLIQSLENYERSCGRAMPGLIPLSELPKCS